MSKLLQDLFPAYFAKADLFDNDDWWRELSPEAKRAYVKQHPNSKYARKLFEEERFTPKAPTGPQIPVSNEPSVKHDAPQKSVRRHLIEALPDKEHWPEHIKNLRLPPAWTDVHYSLDPHADLQAIGKDAKGRDQYVYHEKFAESQAALKFSRIHELHGKREEVRQQIATAQTNPDPVMMDHGDCTRLIFEMGLRPGSDEDTHAEQKAFGATTLEGRHVLEKEDGIYLNFIGKKGVEINLKVEDTDLAGMLKKRAATVGGNGKLFPRVDAKSLLNYVHSLDGKGFKTKDFRTLKGTSAAYEMVEKMQPPANEKQYKKAVKEVAIHVSKLLGNTPTVALASYISPTVFAKWQFGEKNEKPATEEATSQVEISPTLKMTYKNTEYPKAHQYHFIVKHPNLKKQLHISLDHDSVRGDGNINIGDSKGRADYRSLGKLGTHHVRNLLRQIRQHVPTLKTLKGFRTTGARANKRKLSYYEMNIEHASSDDRYLRTDIKTNKGIFAGHQGQNHYDFISSLGMNKYDTNIRHGFLNHKNHFLLGESARGTAPAAKYAKEHRLFHPYQQNLIDRGAHDPDYLTTDDVAPRQFGDVKHIKLQEKASSDDRYLRSAIKHNGKIYVGHQGEYHGALQKRFNLPFETTKRGFINHKNQFLNKDRASKYAHENNLKDPTYSWNDGYVDPYTTSEMLKKRQFPKDEVLKAQAFVSEPYLRTAFKHKNKIYVGHQGQTHLSLLQKHIDPYADDTSGTVGYINHKGHFLDRKQALPYARKHNLIAPHKDFSDDGLISESLKPKEFPKEHILSIASADDRYLRSAVKSGNKLHIGHRGEPHIITAKRAGLSLQEMDHAQSHDNFGFVNHKNQFLNRHKAIKYALTNGLINQNRLKVMDSSEGLITDVLPERAFKRNSIKVEAKEIALVKLRSDWWDSLSLKEQQLYIQQHPKTKYKINKSRSIKKSQPSKITKPKFSYAGKGLDPNNDLEFRQALESTPDVKIVDGGIQMTVYRYQKSTQSGKLSVRTGVFFLPHELTFGYKTDTDYDTYYGGPQSIKGKTIINKPLVVHGTTGGIAPEKAYEALVGRKRLEQLRNWVSHIENHDLENAKKILKDFGGDVSMAEYIVENSREHNQLEYALQEHIIAQEARRQGYDSILAVATAPLYIKNVYKSVSIFTELFHLRQLNYPKPGEAIAAKFNIKPWVRWKFKQSKGPSKTKEVSSRDGILHHFTDIKNARDILDQNQFRLSTPLGTDSDAEKGDKSYFLSTTRNPKEGRYHQGNKSGVMINLHASHLSNNNKIKPVDYWASSKQPKLVTRPFGNEYEDRVFSNKPTIDLPENKTDLIHSMHVLQPDDWKWKHNTRKLMLNAKRHGIPIYLYNNEKHWKNQNTNKALKDKPLINALKGVEQIGYQRSKNDWLDPYLELYHTPRGNPLSDRAKNRHSRLYSMDAATSLKADIHNQKNDPTTAKLVTLIKKHGGVQPFLDHLYQKHRESFVGPVKEFPKKKNGWWEKLNKQEQEDYIKQHRKTSKKETANSWWDKLSPEEQNDYLKEHPKSSLKFHAVPLTNKVYHGTTHDFKNFAKRPTDEYMPDRMLGHHFARDPDIANHFTNYFAIIDNEDPTFLTKRLLKGGRIIPAVIPDDEHFLQADQPHIGYFDEEPEKYKDVPEWRKALTDQTQIGKMVAKVAHKYHPTSLRDFFMEAQNEKPEDAQRKADILRDGGKIKHQGREYDLNGIVDNWTGAFPFNKKTKKEMVDVARSHWQSQGYKGIKYINTSPNEMEHAKDPTSYIVFDPRHIRSRFAKFDPKKQNRFDLLASLKLI